MQQNKRKHEAKFDKKMNRLDVATSAKKAKQAARKLHRHIKLERGVKEVKKVKLEPVSPVPVKAEPGVEPDISVAGAGDTEGDPLLLLDSPSPCSSPSPRSMPEYLALIASRAGRFHGRRFLVDGEVGTATLTPDYPGCMEGNDGTYTMQIDGADSSNTGLNAEQLEPYVLAFDATHREDVSALLALSGGGYATQEEDDDEGSDGDSDDTIITSDDEESDDGWSSA